MTHDLMVRTYTRGTYCRGCAIDRAHRRSWLGDVVADYHIGACDDCNDGGGDCGEVADGAFTLGGE